MLVNQILFEFLFSDLLEFHLAGDLSFNALALGFFALITSLLFVRVCFKQGLIFLLLSIYAINGFFILSLLLRALSGGGVGQLGQTYLRFSHVFRQDVVNVAVLLFLLRLDFLLPARLQDLLELSLLLWAQLVSILEELNELLFSQFDIWAARSIALCLSLFINTAIHLALLPIATAVWHNTNWLSIFINYVHVTVLLHLMLHLLLMD